MRDTAKRATFAVLVGTALVALLALSGVAWAAAFAVTKTAPDGGDTGIARGQRQGLLQQRH